MTEAVPAELRRIVDRLTEVRSQLRQIVETLRGAQEEAAAVSDAETADEETADVATQVRSIIECVLDDSLQPAIRDLRVAAACREKAEGR
jgi:signal transduction histidine kinase